MKLAQSLVFLLLAILVSTPPSSALEKQPVSAYHARRVALAAQLKGGIAILFAAEERSLDFMPYRQDSDFYYLTGWNEPGAALMLVAPDPRRAATRKSCFCPLATSRRNLHRRQDGRSIAGNLAGHRRRRRRADDQVARRPEQAHRHGSPPRLVPLDATGS